MVDHARSRDRLIVFFIVARRGSAYEQIPVVSNRTGKSVTHVSVSVCVLLPVVQDTKQVRSKLASEVAICIGSVCNETLTHVFVNSIMTTVRCGHEQFKRCCHSFCSSIKRKNRAWNGLFGMC